ncbi:MAG: tRNA 2-thiouridine(34) synthase MnmA [Candidatus Eisenbacteria bacterium]|uniref:tRNA-specific 2-thiouridylase MnmA n=1 Tax=Eiseniibacteriota bacterium TaxID=2212470 RepID=A0A849SLE7_UNCEI|nr:tRNA 2-thiouridine(34) synthase MnmA [Candidatus Eisenbacteria bacterium]
MSGGVDSAVAAALLAEQGHEVTGVTMKLWCYGSAPLSPRACCTLDAIGDARAVAQRMGFSHFVVEAEEVFRTRVLQPFLDAYANGRTPHPCSLCNQHLKFGDLIARLELVGAEWLVTGHYARIERAADGSWALLRAVDPDKDQSYALAMVPYASLSRARFPLGALAKHQVRAHAERLELRVWDKPESQDLCFVPDGDYAGFATSKLGETRGTAPGAFVSANGEAVGEHRGIFHYTVGQRRGLGIAGGERLYVLQIDAPSNTVTVGPRAALERGALRTDAMNWMLPAAPPDGTRVDAKVRSRHVAAAATIHACEGGGVEVRFDTPQTAIAPGQTCVLYEGDRVLGGAAIAAAVA